MASLIHPSPASELIKPPNESLILGRNPDHGRFFHTHPQHSVKLFHIRHINELSIYQTTETKHITSDKDIY
jgi:hypothetical protein